MFPIPLSEKRTHYKRQHPQQRQQQYHQEQNEVLPQMNKKQGPFMCINCQKSYKYFCDLKRHMKWECLNRVKNFACTLCDKRYYRKSHLTVHMQKHAQTDYINYDGARSEIIIPEIETNSDLDLNLYLMESSRQHPRY